MNLFFFEGSFSVEGNQKEKCLGDEVQSISLKLSMIFLLKLFKTEKLFWFKLEYFENSQSRMTWKAFFAKSSRQKLKKKL